MGDHVTIMQHVTLGGTGNERGDRHPKIGNHVQIGVKATILGECPLLTEMCCSSLQLLHLALGVRNPRLRKRDLLID